MRIARYCLGSVVVCFLISIYPFIAFGVDDATAFQQTLAEFLTVSKSYIEMTNNKEIGNKEEGKQQFTLVLQRMREFAETYPQSRFSDDARLLVVCASFLDALKNKDKDKAQENIKQMQNLIDTCPKLQLDEFTIERCKRSMSIPVSSALLSIPYSSIVPFMEGAISWEFGDYAAVAENFGVLKDKMDYKKDKYGLLAENIYVKLYDAYVKIGKNDEAKKIAREAIDKFPDHRNLRRHMRKVLRDSGDIQYGGKEDEQADREKIGEFGLGI